MAETVTSKKIYVGCSLTEAPEWFVANVEALKSKLRELGYKVFDFVGVEDGTARDVYNWDIDNCVRKCDLLVGICDLPSMGLGYELGVATELGKPVLAVAHADSRVTRLILGTAEVETNFTFARYDDLVADVPGMVDALIAGEALPGRQ